MTKQEALFEYCMRLGDSSLILGHRISEWCGHGPILETDIALTNIALDLVGQATTMLDYAAKVEGNNRSADDLAYHRDAIKYRNALLCEQPNGDFGQTIARSFLFDTFHYHFLETLRHSKDETLSAYAVKSLKEVTYHLRHSSEWIIRLGDGTEESKERMQTGLNEMWMYSGELFDMDEIDNLLVEEGIAVDLESIKKKFEHHVEQILTEATLTIPENTWMQSGGKQGRHSEHLGYILAEMQYVQRAYPGCEW